MGGPPRPRCRSGRAARAASGPPRNACATAARARPGEQVVGVHPADDVARGRAKPLVDGVRLAGVGLDDEAKPVRVALEDLARCRRCSRRRRRGTRGRSRPAGPRTLGSSARGTRAWFSDGVTIDDLGPAAGHFARSDGSRLRRRRRAGASSSARRSAHSCVSRRTPRRVVGGRDGHREDVDREVEEADREERVRRDLDADQAGRRDEQLRKGRDQDRRHVVTSQMRLSRSREPLRADEPDHPHEEDGQDGERDRAAARGG